MNKCEVKISTGYAIYYCGELEMINDDGKIEKILCKKCKDAKNAKNGMELKE